MNAETDRETSCKIANMSLVCACIVALSHVGWNSAAGSAGWWFVRMTRFGVCCMAVPFFFMVSGYLISRHFGEDGWWRRETSKRLATLVVPYLFWSAAFYAFARLGGSSSPLLHVAGAMLDAPPFLTPLWYVRALLVLVLLAPVFAFVTRKSSWGWIATVSLFAVYFIVSPHKNGLRSSTAQHFFYYGLSLFGAAYFCLGATLRRTGIPSPSRRVALVGGVLAFFLGVGLVALRTFCISRKMGDHYNMLSVAIPFLVSGMWLAIPSAKWPKWLTSMSFPIYVMHFFVVYAMDGFARVHADKSIWLIVLETAAAIALPVAAAALMDRFLRGFPSVVFGGRGLSRGNGNDAGRVERAMAVFARCLWDARWWILFSLVLCAVDETIRYHVLWHNTRRTIRCFAFYSAMTIAPVFLLGRGIRLVAPFLFSFWILVEGLQCWVAVNFRMVLGGNWILMLFSTSEKELSEFFRWALSPGAIAAAVLCIAAAAAAFVFFASRRRPFVRLSWASVLLAAACVAIQLRLMPKLFNRPWTWSRISGSLLMLHFPTDSLDNWSSYRKLAKASRETPPYSLSLSGEPRLCVFVIGESLTRSHMSLYGYKRKTTPGLDGLRDNGSLTAFSGLTTLYSTTPEAICSLLTDSELGRGSNVRDLFPSLLNKAGYKTSLISCQGHWQAKDIVGTYIFSACDSKRFLQGDKVPGTLPDGVALPEIVRAIRENKSPFALFVHLYGCHHPAKLRVPQGFDRQWPGAGEGLTNRKRREVDEYDTAVAYGDHVLSSIIRDVESLHVPSCVFFVSDHGESPDSTRWRDVKSKDVYEIPLAIWLSPEYRAAFPETAGRVQAAKDRKLLQSNLMEGMLELAGVHGYPEGRDGGNFLDEGAIGARKGVEE